jgi:hypothetical protein
MWYKPLDWVNFCNERGPFFPLVIFRGTYAYLKMELEVGGVFWFELYDFAQSGDPVAHFKLSSLEGLRESSEGEAAESAAWIAKKMIRDSLHKAGKYGGWYDSFDR